MRWSASSGVLSFLLLLAVACSVPARGAEPPPRATGPWQRVVLVELFTSQGCSSCPAADALLRDLPALGLGRDKVLPLSFHVDYWDGLGWKDPFASRTFTERQEWYARPGRLRAPDGQSRPSGLYTPQMVVGGMVHFSGQRRELALGEMRRAAGRPPLVEMTAEAQISGQVVKVNVRARPRAGLDTSVARSLDTAKDWRILVALTAKKVTTRVLHGENGGETLEEAAVVRDLSAHIPFSPSSLASGGAISASVSKPPELPWTDVELVVFVQSEVTGEVAAALISTLPRS